MGLIITREVVGNCHIQLNREPRKSSDVQESVDSG